MSKPFAANAQELLIAAAEALLHGDPSAINVRRQDVVRQWLLTAASEENIALEEAAWRTAHIAVQMAYKG